MGLTCLIDSNGAHDFSKYPQLLALCDGVMLDVKAVDPHFHQKLCGADNAMVLRNLDYLLKNGKLQEVRTVLLPNEKEQNRKTVSYVSARIKDRSQYKLIRYRPYGVREAGLKAFGNQTLAMEEVAELVEICEKIKIIYAGSHSKKAYWYLFVDFSTLFSIFLCIKLKTLKFIL